MSYARPNLRDMRAATALPLARRLPSTTSATAGIAPAVLFGSFSGTTQQSDFPRYEQDFLGFSYGFRPGKSAHNALDAVSVGVEQRKVNWILDADISKFYDTIEHDWLVRFASALNCPHLALRQPPVFQHTSVQPLLDEPHNPCVRYPVLDEIAFSTSTVASWTSLSSSAGTPSGRLLPSALSMYTRLTGWGR